MAPQQPGSIATSIDSPSWDGSKLSFSVRQPAAGTVSFVGTLSDDGNWLDGWMFNGPLKFERVPHLRKKPVSVAVSNPPTAPPSPASATEPVSQAASSAALSRALAKLAGTSQRLLKYACLETVERTYYNEPSPELGAHPMSDPAADSCAGRDFSDFAHLALYATDRVRLQVAVADGKEIYSWASASRFDSRRVSEMIPSGPTTTGAFGTQLVDIFENPGAKFTFQGRMVEQQREIFQYHFDVPLAASHSRVRGAADWITTGYHGAFEIEAATGDLVRLDSETEPTPPETRMCRSRMATEYRYAQIGDGRFLLPSQSQFDVLPTNGGETRSVITFANCHEYAAESSLSYDEQAPGAEAGAAPQSAPPLPPGISLTLALLSPIDTATAAAGDAVAAKVTKAARAPRTSEILVDAGAIVHGRVTQMRRQYGASQFQFAIRYETIEQRGAVAPLAIELERELKAEQTRGGNALSTRGSEFTLAATSAPADAGGWFSVPGGAGRYVVSAGTESKWVTVAQ